MKIGILTQPLRQNYGGLLQNWALQQVLIKMGHTPKTIIHDEPTKLTKLKDDIGQIVRCVIKYCLLSSNRHLYKFPWYYSSKTKKINSFSKKNILKSRLYSEPEKLDENDFDYFIVGSDQTWRPCFNRIWLGTMFGSFIHGYSANRIISYAASFGVCEWELTKSETIVAANNIKKFKSVSVREDSGVTLCKTYLNTKAVQVLDPTLLLECKDYHKLIENINEAAVAKNSIGVYFLDLTPQKEAMVNILCDTFGMKAHYFGRPDANGVYPSVESWLYAFDKCDFIITDSFHGSVFAINYKKPFISIINNERGATRFKSLLGLLNLEDRMIDTNEIATALILFKKTIDWDYVIDVINNERDKSMMFLKNNLIINA